MDFISQDASLLSCALCLAVKGVLHLNLVVFWFLTSTLPHWPQWWHHWTSTPRVLCSEQPHRCWMTKDSYFRRWESPINPCYTGPDSVCVCVWSHMVLIIHQFKYKRSHHWTLRHHTVQNSYQKTGRFTNPLYTEAVELSVVPLVIDHLDCSSGVSWTNGRSDDTFMVPKKTGVFSFWVPLWDIFWTFV